jgi:A/G-specific adenine glycosylase
MLNKALINWSHEQYSHLPWRQKRSLYTTLVSEIMLQQTTVGTVLSRFGPFIKKYPTVKSLAKASEKDVCAAWEGLGYYRRARNLRKAAITIVEDYGGEFPSDITELKKIPGIGDYTANAIKAIGMNEHALGVDANLERVLARYYGLKEEKGLKLHKKIKTLFSDHKIIQNLDKLGSRNAHEALMDLGRVYCQAKRADCHLCPLKKKCVARLEEGSPLDYPVISEALKKSKSIKHEVTLLRILVKRGRKYVGHERLKSQWLQGQIELPTFILQSTDEKLKQYPILENVDLDKNLPLVKSAITKYKISNIVLKMTKSEFDDFLAEHSLIKGDYSYFDVDTSHFSTTSKKVMS